MSWLGQSSQLDKYVKDVNDYLPRRLRKDISTELRANLQDRIADREEEVGRQLTDEESVELLNEYGHPIRVAASYHGATHGLVSAELFPYFKRAILAAFIVALINLIVFAGLEIMYDITIGSSSWAWRFINTFMYMVGSITAAFYIAERVMERNKFLSRWKPKKSNALDPDTVSIWGAIFTVVALLTWLAILNSVPIEHNLAVLLGSTGNRFHTLLYWMKIQLVLVILFHLMLVFKRENSKFTQFVRGGIELVLAFGCVLCLLISTNSTREIYADIAAPVLTGLDYAIWIFLAASVLTAAYYFRKGLKIQTLALGETDSGSEPELEPEALDVAETSSADSEIEAAAEIDEGAKLVEESRLGTDLESQGQEKPDQQEPVQEEDSAEPEPESTTPPSQTDSSQEAESSPDAKD